MGFWGLESRVPGFPRPILLVSVRTRCDDPEGCAIEWYLRGDGRGVRGTYGKGSLSQRFYSQDPTVVSSVRYFRVQGLG